MLTSGTVDDGQQFVTLGIDRDVFAVEVAGVREILDVPPIAGLPNSPPYLLGMIDVRGECVPIIDLRVKLGFPAIAHTNHTRILVLEIEVEGRILTIGLLTDRVFEVTPLDGGDMEAPPDIGVRWRSDYIKGVGRRGENFVVVFNLSRLLSSEEAAAILSPATA